MNYPENIVYDFDHKALSAYLKTSWFFKWFGILGIFEATFALMPFAEWLEGEVLLGKAIFISMWILIGTVGVSTACYLLFSHFRASATAKPIFLRVEGSFLVTGARTGVFAETRRVHFRSATDYSVEETWLMKRFGIKQLGINTSGSGPKARILIPGILECERVSSELAEIDSQRE